MFHGWTSAIFVRRFRRRQLFRVFKLKNSGTLFHPAHHHMFSSFRIVIIEVRLNENFYVNIGPRVLWMYRRDLKHRRIRDNVRPLSQYRTELIYCCSAMGPPSSLRLILLLSQTSIWRRTLLVFGRSQRPHQIFVYSKVEVRRKDEKKKIIQMKKPIYTEVWQLLIFNVLWWFLIACLTQSR